MGTAAYMSPEQASGKTADRRTDIWSFGAVLYEMLAGKKAFEGESVSDTLASVLKLDPDWDALPSGTPASIRKLVRRCLTKDRKQRLQAIGEARIILNNPTVEESLPVTAPSRSRLGMGASITAGLLLIGLGILSFIHFRETAPPKTLLRYTIAAPENTSLLHSFAISPDGRYVAISATVNGKQQLWLRALDALQAQPMPGTDTATYPFWSPDSRYIGFSSIGQGKLKKIAVSGGPAQSLCDVVRTVAPGGSWNRDNVIVFASSGDIERVSAAGGVPAAVTRTKGSAQFPVFLPDGRHFLYYVTGVSAEQDGVYVSSLDGKENRRLLADESSAIFAAGRLLFIRENTLMAQPFDAASGQIVGDVLPVAEGISLTGNGRYAPVTASETGVLLYESGGTAAGGNQQMGWYDRGGKLLGPIGAPGLVFEPAISPDEKSVVFRRIASNVGAADLWLWDLTRATERRFTTDAFPKFAPIWAPKGDRILFASTRGGPSLVYGAGIFDLYQKAPSGTGQEELLLANGNLKVPDQWSRDGRFIVYSENDPKTKWDMWVLSMDGGAERKSGPRAGTPFLHSEFNELLGQLSPDDHWMAYTSDKTGHREVYVVSFPTGEGETRISIAGGEQPRWRGDGKELFFEGADGKMMTVAVKAGLPAGQGNRTSFEPGVPQSLFEARLPVTGRTTAFQYDVTADGKRFLLDAEGGGSAAAPPLTVVVNWDAGAKK